MLSARSVVSDLQKSGIVRVDDGPMDAGLTLRLPFFDATAQVTQAQVPEDFVFFIGQLKNGVGNANLRHQGALSGLAQLKEQKLGIKAVDDAFIVAVDDDGFALLTQCKAELLALIARGVDPAATLAVAREEFRAFWPGTDLEHLPRLWEKLVSLRTGA